MQDCMRRAACSGWWCAPVTHLAQAPTCLLVGLHRSLMRGHMTASEFRCAEHDVHLYEQRAGLVVFMHCSLMLSTLE